MSSRGQIGLPPKIQPSKYTDKEYLWTLHQGDLLLLKREPRTEERATSFCAICAAAGVHHARPGGGGVGRGVCGV